MSSHKSWMLTVVLTCFIFMQMCRPIDSYPEEDGVINLPGQPRVSFQQYAGYVTIDEIEQRALFYYFVEAESNPASKPLVLWLNGGPGYSSVGAGAFSEHGPFRPSDRGILIRNEYSWNKVANILYLDSPAGVGFSYSANASFYSYVNDTITAQDNLKFLELWYLKFPEYKNRDFFITGESYAGHYVPQLTQLIIQSGLYINLKGVAIGNPLLDLDTDFNGRAEFLWSHGCITDSTYQLLTTACNYSTYFKEDRIYNSLSPACSNVVKHIEAETPDGINGYDIIADVCLSYDNGQLQFQAKKHHLLAPRFQPWTSIHSKKQAFNNHPKAKENIDACVLDKTHDYLNRKDVQQALHARLVGVNDTWTFYSRVLNYDLQNLETPTIGVVGSLVNRGIPVLVYSGDQDFAIPFMGSRSLVDRLAKEMGLNSTVPYSVWYGEDKQVGGWTQVYGNNILSYATIRGGSHMAPLSSPMRSLTIFKAFLAGRPLRGELPN